MSLAFDPPPATPPPGRLGKYELQAEIGRGGMGIVYRGYDTQLNRPAAIKVLAPALSGDPHFIRRFQKEAIAAASLAHPHIVTIYDVGQEGDTHFIAMALLTGMPLSRWVQMHGPLSPAQANSIIKQIASALDYAHQRRMVHCDVKPANIMFRPGKGGHATLMDFGLVRARTGDVHTEGMQSGSGDSDSLSGDLAAGTPEYMAPEQVLGGEVDPRTDVYACGAVLYYLLVGQPPFERAVPAAIAYAQVNELPPSLRKLRPDLPRPVEAVVLKALAKQPADRYPSAGALATDFAIAVTGRMPPGLRKTPTPEALPSKRSQILPAPAATEVKASRVLPGPAAEVCTGPAAASSPAQRSPAPIVTMILVLLIAVVVGLAWVLARDAQVQPTPTAEAVALFTLTPTARPPTQPPPAATATQVIIVPPPIPTVVRPTTTLAARRTLAATPTATRATLMPTPTFTPPAAPQLVAPADDFSTDGEVIFEWEWEGILMAGLAFEIRLWKDGSFEHLGAYALVSPSVGGRAQQRVDLRLAPAVRTGGNGVYWWTVAVVRAEPYERIGPEAAPRRLYYNGG